VHDALADERALVNCRLWYIKWHPANENIGFSAILYIAYWRPETKRWNKLVGVKVQAGTLSRNGSHHGH
jgi:hypothetical protein